MKQFFLTLLLSALTLAAACGQSYGHVNFGNLLSQMPDVTSAEAALQTFEKEKMAVGEKMVADFQEKVKKLQAVVNDITPKELAIREAALEKEQLTIQQFEQKMGRDIEVKRQELLGPIIQKAKDAVEAVGKEKKMTLVFDSSIFGTVLFAEDVTDLTAAVKMRLGIK
jgi:outer membrane protein